ncbi:MAG: bifunctional [glutamate--ammonia ligase]-adenylyl-L-tyrosine phosphorylase/[glutamate--ammonia-ligase] adenylyltransferase [Planctomycetota bacterium]|jgi:glutamate-ammonia-ligase adenylyltransferase
MKLDALARFEGMADRVPEVEAYLQGAADASGVVVGLQRLLEAGADLLPHLAGWLRLLDASPAAVETLVRRPALVAEIPRTGGTYERADFERELDEALAGTHGLEARLDHLRAVRVEESLRIAWQDVVEGADLTVVTRRISDLAETLLERVLGQVNEELARRFGRPWHDAEPVGLAILAMGKLGGAELNYASDVDLIFVYGKDGETDGGETGITISNREYFHRLTERVTREANAVTARGRLYRVDLRLRPEGAVGSLARSLASSLKYYRRMGETWERQALLKVRVIAGDRGIGAEFVESVRDWVYGRGLDFEEIGALKRVKRRMEEITAHRGEQRREVKLGYGGIRDVEYVIQFLQLLHGSHAPDVRHHNSLAALRLLERAEAILPAERDVLDDAYRFLRLVEHRLQLVQGAQVHRIPADPTELAALARRCGFSNTDAFRRAHAERAEGVRTIFNRLFREIFAERDAQQARETDLVLKQESDPAALAEVLQAHGITDVAKGIYAVGELGKEGSRWLAGSPRTRKFFADLFPRLLNAIEETPDPDGALSRLERITARVGARATLYQAMNNDVRLLRLLVDLAGNSRFLSNILERTPGTLDQLVDALATETGRGLASFEDIPVATVPSAPDPARILADYKNLEMLRIGLRDVRGMLGIREVSEDMTRLAEVIVRLAFERARSEARTAGAELVVCALGKFGAGELLYGSDLDLVFFTRDGPHLAAATAVARRLSTLLATPTAHGRLYEVDFRLRPGGSSGPLVATPSGFSDYFARGVGQTWERMAYTRARPVAGPPTLCEEITDAIAATIYPPGFSPDDARSMAEMRTRLAEAGGPDSIKRAASGGVVDLEFLTQMHALSGGRANARFRVGNVPRLLARMKECGAIEPQRAADLFAAYSFLLTLESKIRIVADLPEDRLPEEPAARRALARRLGYVDSEATPAEDSLRDEYAYHRDVAARAFHEGVAKFSQA